MSVEISAENRQEYQAWTPVEEDLEGLPKNIHDLILYFVKSVFRV